MPTSATKEPQEYALFLESLEITERAKVALLANLLRDVYEASTKLDLHLEPHGASFHSALSRVLTTDNPHDVRSLFCIRVVDRMGFFTDDDTYAKRIVNVGLAFAYRHKQLDTLAASGVLRQEAGAANRLRAVEVSVHDDDAIPVGKVGAGDGTSVEGSDGGGADEDSADVPVRGFVLDRPHAGAQRRSDPPQSLPLAAGVAGAGDGGDDPNGVNRGGVVVARRSGALVPMAPEAAVGDGGGDPPGISGVLPGGIVVARRSAAAAGAAGDGDGDGDDGADDSQLTGFPSTIHEQQPVVEPSADALQAVSYVLGLVEERDDALGDLRGLLSERLKVLQRYRPPHKVKRSGSSSSGGGCAVHALVEPWWPIWQAPRDGIKVSPAPGIFGYHVNSLRPVWKTRWCIKVDMKKTKSRLDRIHANHPKIFERDGRPAIEVVVLLVQARPLRLTVVIACMVLMETKEPD